MEIFDIQVLLKDGSLADYQVQNERDSDIFKVYKHDEPVAIYKSKKDGTWQLTENDAQIDEDLQQRIINQLNGLRY